MDHDSIGGSAEFIEAGKLAQVSTTCGLECRVSFDATPMAGRRLNNPDQKSNAYMALHGVPFAYHKRVQEFFAPLREKRNVRNRNIVANINALSNPHGVTLDFDKDVLPISMYREGGSVTERHLLYALGNRIIDVAGMDNTARFLEQAFGIVLSAKQLQQMTDFESPHFRYDLLGILKAELVEKIYVPATDECVPLSELVKLAKEINAILCYAYLGDVGDSVTGDKKTAKFEDEYLDELFDVLKAAGVEGVTYMPSRNTAAQLSRLQALCTSHGLKEISGEDINSPRQSFICTQLADPRFSHLVDATWRLIAHENGAAT